MAKEIDGYIGGVVKKVKKVPVCVGGVVKEAKKGFAGVGGVVKEFFSSGYEIVFEDDNDGLAKIYSRYDVSGQLVYDNLYLYSGKVKSTAAIRIYGDFAGKELRVSATRDTDHGGGLGLYDSNGNVLESIGLSDGEVLTRITGTYDNAAYFRLSVIPHDSGGGSASIDSFTIDGVDQMPIIHAYAVEQGWTTAPW